MADILVVKCGSCGAGLKTSPAAIGRAVRCPRCGATVPVAAATGAGGLLEAARAAAGAQAGSSATGQADSKVAATAISGVGGGASAGSGARSGAARATRSIDSSAVTVLSDETPTIPDGRTGGAGRAVGGSSAARRPQAPGSTGGVGTGASDDDAEAPTIAGGEPGSVAEDAPTRPAPASQRPKFPSRSAAIGAGEGAGPPIGSREATSDWLRALGAVSVDLAGNGAGSGRDGSRKSGSVQGGSTAADPDAPAKPLPAELSLGSEDKYEVLRELARGGMGAVLLTRDRNVNRDVAMKVMLRQSEAGPAQVYRFLEEAQVTGQLEHPNIVPVHDVGIDAQGRLFFTMKLVRGRSLKDVLDGLREGKDKSLAEEFSLTRLLSTFMQVCNAVGFANDRGVVHRDLKPANIMLGAFGEVLVMDWGLARVQGRRGSEAVSDVRTARSVGGSEMTEDGQIAGTPQYMPPEQAMGDQLAIDARSDVYSLGAILYTILTLRPPYQGRDATTIITKVLHEPIEPPRIAPVFRSVPRELPAIAMKAMSKDKAARYQSAMELVADVERYLEGRTVTALPDGPVRRAWKWAKRNRAVVLGTVAALVLSGGSLGGYAWMKSAEAAETRRAEIDGELKAGVDLLLEGNYSSGTEDGGDAYAAKLQQTSVRRVLDKNSRDLSEASRRFRRVLELDPDRADARGKLMETYLKLWNLALARGEVHLMTAYGEELRTAAGSQAFVDKYQKQIRGDGMLTLHVTNVDAEAHLFRFEQNDDQYGRLVPVPEQPGRERAADHQPDFEAAGYPKLNLRSRQAPPRGRSDGFPDSTYAFVCGTANRIGTGAGREFRVDPMPLGSYVVVLKAAGHEPLRLPVNIVRKPDGFGEHVDLTVSLLPKAATLPGYRYVPRFRAVLGGAAAGSLFPFPKAVTVGPVLIAEDEVSLADYFEFLGDLLKAGRREDALRHRPRSFDPTKAAAVAGNPGAPPAAAGSAPADPAGKPGAEAAGGFLVEFDGDTVKPLDAWGKLTPAELKTTPVTGVNWHDAAAYAAWKSAKDGRKYRLPTDEEWEAAARGADGRTFSWGELFRPEAAKLTQGYGAFTEAMLAELRRSGCSFDESVFGVRDLGGSVAEWTGSDFIDPGPAGPDGKPPVSQFKSIRGNAWGLTPTGMQCAFRTTGASLNYFHQTIGFRLAAEVPAGK